MTPVDREDFFDSALRLLISFGENTGIRGRFVIIYLGLRRMGDALAPLGSAKNTTVSEVETYLDRLYTKTNRAAPFTVLTSPFGQSTSPNAPWSTVTGALAPGNRYPTNTWRNNLNVQKGIGCPAEPKTIRALLSSPGVRSDCPFMGVDSEGRQKCGITGATYRGEQHSIWLRKTKEGHQVVDLDQKTVYEQYLAPQGQRIPIFALIPVLYHAAPSGVYPRRRKVGVREFCDDFGLSVNQAEEMFDCDPESPGNSDMVLMASSRVGKTRSRIRAARTQLRSEVVRTQSRSETKQREAGPLPPQPDLGINNTGVAAEIAVAKDLQDYDWTVEYTGNIRRIGHDLVAKKDGKTLRIEVKSSISICRPTLTEEEWKAAEQHGDCYVLAVVDFVGSDGQRISYVRNPVADITPSERQVTIFGVARRLVDRLGTGTQSL